MNFQEQKKLTEKVFPCRLLGSKGQYSFDHPNHLVCFNANICTDQGKILHTDIDVTLGEHYVKLLSAALGCRVYVLREMDARFENENKPLLERAVYSYDYSSDTTLIHERYERNCFGRIEAKPEPEPEKARAVREKFLAERARGFKKAEYKVLCKIDVQKVCGKFTKAQDPLSLFWGYLAKQGVKSDKQRMKVILPDKAEATLESLMDKWVRKYHKHLTEYRKQQQVTMAMFQYGPSHFMCSPDWVQDGMVYLRKRVRGAERAVA